MLFGAQETFSLKTKIFAVILPDDIIQSKIPAIKQLMNIYEQTNKGSVCCIAESTNGKGFELWRDKN